ncbi:MAG: hypothetical protein AB7P04_12725, partial [Bacteriovoracia bacterium]
ECKIDSNDTTLIPYWDANEQAKRDWEASIDPELADLLAQYSGNLTRIASELKGPNNPSAALTVFTRDFAAYAKTVRELENFEKSDEAEGNWFDHSHKRKRKGHTEKADIELQTLVNNNRANLANLITIHTAAKTAIENDGRNPDLLDKVEELYYPSRVLAVLNYALKKLDHAEAQNAYRMQVLRNFNGDLINTAGFDDACAVVRKVGQIDALLTALSGGINDLDNAIAAADGSSRRPTLNNVVGDEPTRESITDAYLKARTFILNTTLPDTVLENENLRSWVGK